MSNLLQRGSDPLFDQHVKTLGSSAKHQNRVVIDGLMLWRKSQSTTVDSETVRKNMEEHNVSPSMKAKDVQTLLRERKLLTSNILLNRALIEVVKHIKTHQFPEDLSEKLEEMALTQLRNADGFLAFKINIVF